jgi:hypothetical protein
VGLLLRFVSIFPRIFTNFLVERVLSMHCICFQVADVFLSICATAGREQVGGGGIALLPWLCEVKGTERDEMGSHYARLWRVHEPERLLVHGRIEVVFVRSSRSRHCRTLSSLLVAGIVL